jgi:cardiolipin synthase
MDMRSFLHNQEVNLIVLGDDFGAEMEAMFQNDVADAEAVTMKNWSDRSLSLRMKQWFSRIWSYWL